MRLCRLHVPCGPGLIQDVLTPMVLTGLAEARQLLKATRLKLKLIPKLSC